MKTVVNCPAKINLCLRVGSPDATGYHPIRTIFQAISLTDTLTIDWNATADAFSCEGQELPDENTVTKAWRLLKEAVALPRLAVHLEKRIPSEAGLGGGSSDAAGLIRAVQRRFGIPDYLAGDIALAVGSDVPFFLVGGQARGEGRGEILKPLPDPAIQHLLIGKPDVGVGTGAAYRALDAMPRDFGGFEPINDFELVMPPECHEMKRRLQDLGASSAMLSGSGSAVFGLFDQPISALGFISARFLTREESLSIS